MRPKRHNTQKDILFILISSFIVVVAWIGFNLYHIWATSTVNEEIQLQLTPIAATFDATTMQQLKTRENVNPIFDVQGQPSTTASSTATQNQPASASSSAATASGNGFASNNTPITIQGQ